MHMRSIRCVAPTSFLKTHKISIHSNADIKDRAYILFVATFTFVVFSMLFHPCIMYPCTMDGKIYNQGINIEHAHDYNHITRTYYHNQQMAQNLVLQFFALFLFRQTLRSVFSFSFSWIVVVVIVVDATVAIDYVIHLTSYHMPAISFTLIPQQFHIRLVF